MTVISSSATTFTAPGGGSYELAADAYRIDAAVGMVFGGSNQAYTIGISGYVQGAFMDGILLTGANTSVLTINAMGAVKGGVGIQSSHSNSTITNHGLIAGGSAIARDAGGGAMTVDNTGFLVSDTTFGSYATVAVSGNADFTLTNSGLIRSTTGYPAIYSYGSSVDIIKNSGRIEGVVNLGNGSGDTVTNSGVIKGAIYLGAGSDSYNGTGSIGVHTIAGGTGADSYIVNSNDIIIEAANGEIDDVTALGSYVLAATVEVETLRAVGGKSAINLTGNAVAQNINGNEGDNILNPGVDSVQDFLSGKGGNDTYVLGGNVNDKIIDTAGVDTITSTISRSLVNTALFTGTIENLVLLGTGNISGTGNTAANVITGNEGNNVLSSGTDALVDTLIGNGGDDTYELDYSATNDKIIDTSGIDTIRSGLNKTSLADARITGTIENLVLLSSGTTGIGNEVANKITGTSGNDKLDGGEDFVADTLNGGAGDDLYTIRSSNDVIIDLARTRSMDVVQSTVSYVLGASVEIEDFRAFNELGRDTLSFTGNDFAQQISGNNGNNILRGLGGKDVLQGNLGRDTLVGGADSDTFLFGYMNSGQTKSTCDVISDFQKGAVNVGDKISFSDDLSVGLSLAAATSSKAQINAQGIASFAANSGKTFADALSDVAWAMTGTDFIASKFAFFKVNGAGNYYMMISDAEIGVSDGDTIIQLDGITSIKSISLAGGDLSILL